MDFQLILYIIIVIVWLVLDNYRRIKKKQEYSGKSTTSTPQSPTEKPYTTLEDILKEFGMDEPEPEVIVERKSKPVKKTEKPKPAPVKYETYESNVNKDYKFSSESHKRDFTPVSKGGNMIAASEIGKSEDKDKESAKLDFDLRKAVIWSEILKRPYS